MPITPDQARLNRDHSVIAAVLKLSAEIDAYLGATYRSISGEWYFSISGRPDAAVDAVIPLYQKAGWSVRRGSDRDGSFLVFSERTP